MANTTNDIKDHHVADGGTIVEMRVDDNVPKEDPDRVDYQGDPINKKNTKSNTPFATLRRLFKVWGWMS